MGYVAVHRLKWGDGYIEPGESVPSGDHNRNYRMMLQRGDILVHADPRLNALGPHGGISSERAPRGPGRPKKNPESAGSGE